MSESPIQLEFNGEIGKPLRNLPYGIVTKRNTEINNKIEMDEVSISAIDLLISLLYRMS